MAPGEGGGAEHGEYMVYQGKDAALYSGSLGNASGVKFDLLAAEAALDDFLAATLLRDDVLKVIPPTLSQCGIEHWCAHSAR